jgi:hypothetical protein
MGDLMSILMGITRHRVEEMLANLDLIWHRCERDQRTVLLYCKPL